MSERIRQLEDALAILHPIRESEPHPLLKPELMRIKSNLDLHSASTIDFRDVDEQDESDWQDIDAFGTLAIRDDGAATFFGRSAGHEV